MGRFCAAFNQAGGLSVPVGLRRRFPGIIDNAHARTCVRDIVGWRPPAAAVLPAFHCLADRGALLCANHEAALFRAPTDAKLGFHWWRNLGDRHVQSP